MSNRTEAIQKKRRQQPLTELRRKANKAHRPGWWTQEDCDYFWAEVCEDLWPGLCEAKEKPHQKES